MVVLALIMGGCATQPPPQPASSLTLPVHGQFNKSAETFIGTATGYPDGAGDVDVVLSSGVKCSGKFVYITAREGEGVFACSDSQTAPFYFATTGMRGTGYGTMGNDTFTFTFGD